MKSPPLYRSDDPESSVLGAQQIEPDRDTCKAIVAELLASQRGHWVSGHAILEAAGTQGLRRLT